MNQVSKNFRLMHRLNLIDYLYFEIFKYFQIILQKTKPHLMI